MASVVMRPVHLSALHDTGHMTSIAAYVHEPAEQVPGELHASSVVADAHVGAGGVLHARGSPAQAPFEQVSLLVQRSPSSQGAPLVGG
jgi:hypothetical protein